MITQKIITLVIFIRFHADATSILYPGEERYFKSIRQLTFSGTNAEAYFSFDDRQITFQATNFGYKCDQIFRFENVRQFLS